MSEVKVSKVWKYFGRQPVLENINLDVESGSFVSIVGPSGCGKSTFLRMLLSQESQTEGEILLDGQPISPEPSEERGVVFQRYSVFPHLSVEENVALGLEFAQAPFFGKLFGRKKKAALEEARHYLDSVGLDAARGKYPAELSGGMQQRLAIAQALIKKPKVLLLDEPFGALDPGIRSDIHKLMLSLWRETGMTVFMVTHDLREAFHLGNRVIVFDRYRTREEELAYYGATITLDLKLNDNDPLKARANEHYRELVELQQLKQA